MKQIKTFFSSQKNFIVLSTLSVFTLYINQAPHNLSVGLLTLFSLLNLFLNSSAFSSWIKKNSLFFTSLIAYFSLYLILNFYHFYQDFDSLEYALKRSRWILYSLTIIPCTTILLLENNNLKWLNILKFICFLLAGLLLTLIFIDSYTRFFYSQPSTSLFLKSSLNNSFGTRSAWTYNPIPFSKITFFACLLFGCLYLNLKSFLYKWSALLFSICFLLITVATQTRATWLGSILVFPIIFLVVKKSRPFLLAFLILLTGAFFLTPKNLLIKRAQSISISASTFSNTYRIEHWKANLKLSKDHPFIGVGYAANRKEEVLSPYIRKFTENKDLLYGHPHNEYLDILSGAGFFSLVLFILLLVFPILQNYKLLRQKLSPERFNLLFFSSLYLLFIYLTAFFDKITLTTWFTVIICWAISFYMKERLHHEN